MSDNWKHRSSGMRCGRCMFFVEKFKMEIQQIEPAVLFGRCRRHAPAINGFPVVFSTDWCGDHRLDENKI